MKNFSTLSFLAALLLGVSLSNASAQSNTVSARPEELKFPALNYEPPAPEQFHYRLTTPSPQRQL